MRAGAQALTLLASPINVLVIQALGEGPRPLADLRQAADFPPATTMRGHLRAMSELGVVARHRQSEFPGNVDFELTDQGRQLLVVAEVLESWLAFAPRQPLSLGSVAAKSAIKALVEGWSSSIVRALAARPFSLTELDRLIATLNYPSLERRLSAMRLAGQVEPVPGRDRGTPYAATEWLRRAVAPLLVASRWERENSAPEAAPLGHLDTEAAFLLAIPLLRLGPALSGSCRMVVEIGEGESQRLVGAMVEVAGGRIASCISRLEGDPSAWTVGPPAAWLAAMIEGDVGGLEIGGDSHLARNLLDGLHETLFRYDP